MYQVYCCRTRGTGMHQYWRHRRCRARVSLAIRPVVRHRLRETKHGALEYRKMRADPLHLPPRRHRTRNKRSPNVRSLDSSTTRITGLARLAGQDITPLQHSTFSHIRAHEHSRVVPKLSGAQQISAVQEDGCAISAAEKSRMPRCDTTPLPCGFNEAPRP